MPRRPARNSGAARSGRPIGAPLVISPAQRELMAQPRPGLAPLAPALGVSLEMLRRELRGVRAMPEARRVALWYLLDGCR